MSPSALAGGSGLLVSSVALSGLSGFSALVTVIVSDVTDVTFAISPFCLSPSLCLFSTVTAEPEAVVSLGVAAPTEHTPQTKVRTESAINKFFFIMDYLLKLLLCFVYKDIITQQH